MEYEIPAPSFNISGFVRSNDVDGPGVRVNVEYVSTNPTGPLHVGHARGAVFGDALASLLAFTGHAVTLALTGWMTTDYENALAAFTGMNTSGKNLFVSGLNWKGVNLVSVKFCARLLFPTCHVITSGYFP